MHPGRVALIVGLALIATAIAAALALTLTRSLTNQPRPTNKPYPLANLSTYLVTAAILLLAAPSVTRQLAAASPTPSISPTRSGATLWPIVGMPVAAASIALGLLCLRRSTARRPHAPLWIGSAAVAGTLTVVLSFAGRMVLSDALLICVALPAWIWFVEAASTPTPPHQHSPQNPATTPGPIALLGAALASPILAYLALDQRLDTLVGLLQFLLLLALIIPVALAAPRTSQDAQPNHWAAAPIFLIATIPPLAALAASCFTRIWITVDRAGDETHAAGLGWLVGAAEAIASFPYLPGITSVAPPALLSVALPLMYVSMDGVSPRIRRLAGVGILIAGVGLALRGLLGNP